MKSLALVNGRIHTMDGGPVKEALFCCGDHILAVGSSSEIRDLCDGRTEIVDLGGKAVFPGFNDSHMHFLNYAIAMESVDLRGVRSTEEIIERTRTFIAEKGRRPGEWVAGRGWNEELFDVRRCPTREDLDRVSTEHPIILDRICGHLGVANSCALEMLRVKPGFSVEGGTFEVGDDGRLNGFVREAALDWFRRQLPKPTKNDVQRLISDHAGEALSLGLTSLQTDDLGSVNFDHRMLVRAYMEMDERGDLPIRITEQFLLTRREILLDFLSTGLRTGDGSSHFHVGPLKLLTDGSLGARTALLRGSYADDPGNCGVSVYSQEDLDDLVMTAHRAGMQVATHAIGDGALEMCVNAMERAIAEVPRDARHYVVHCQFGDRNLYSRMAKAGIMAAIQPPFVPSDYAIVPSRVGEERMEDSYAWKSMRAMGIHTSGGSDCPVESFNPLWGIHAAATRTTREGAPRGGWLPEECLSLDEAIALYTRDGAYTSFEEDVKGTLSVGKLADMAILEEDLYDVSPQEIPNVKVSMTICGGRIVYSNV